MKKIFLTLSLCALSLSSQKDTKTPTPTRFDERFLSSATSFCKRAAALGSMIGNPKTCQDDVEKIIRILGQGAKCSYSRLARSTTFPCLRAFRKNFLDQKKKGAHLSNPSIFWSHEDTITEENRPAYELNKNLIPMIMGSLHYVLTLEEKKPEAKTALSISNDLLKKIMGEKNKNGHDNLAIHGQDRKRLEKALKLVKKSQNSVYIYVRTKHILDLFATLVYSTQETQTGLTLNKKSQDVSEIYLEWLTSQLYDIAHDYRKVSIY